MLLRSPIPVVWPPLLRLSSWYCLSDITLPGHKNRTSNARGPHRVWRRTNFASPYGARQSFRCMTVISLWAPYGFRYHKQSINSPRGDRKWPVRAPHGHTTPVRDFCKLWLCQFPYVSVRCRNFGFNGPRTGPVGYDKHWRFPCGPERCPHEHRTGSMWSLAEWFVKPLVYSRVNGLGPVAWCDYEAPA